jgi:hypothetical protein
VVITAAGACSHAVDQPTAHHAPPTTPPTRSESPQPEASATRFARGETYAVASDGRHLWATTRTVGKGAERWWIVEQDPATGTTLRRVSVPGPLDVMTVGLGRVWAFGGGDGAYPDGVLNAVDPETLQVATRALPGTGAYSVDFAADAAWAVLAAHGQVVRLDVRGRTIDITATVTVPGATQLVSTTDGNIWARALRPSRLVRIAATARVTGSFPWPSRGGLLGPAGRHQVWASDDPHRVITLRPDGIRCCPSLSTGYRIGVPGRPLAVALDSHGGLYVAVYGHRDGIAYYADYAHLDGNAGPTAFWPAKNAHHLAADPAGGVVFTANFREYRWVPLR